MDGQIAADRNTVMWLLKKAVIINADSQAAWGIEEKKELKCNREIHFGMGRDGTRLIVAFITKLSNFIHKCLAMSSETFSVKNQLLKPSLLFKIQSKQNSNFQS